MMHIYTILMHTEKDKLFACLPALFINALLDQIKAIFISLYVHHKSLYHNISLLTLIS